MQERWVVPGSGEQAEEGRNLVSSASAACIAGPTNANRTIESQGAIQHIEAPRLVVHCSGGCYPLIANTASHEKGNLRPKCKAWAEVIARLFMCCQRRQLLARLRRTDPMNSEAKELAWSC